MAKLNIDLKEVVKQRIKYEAELKGVSLKEFVLRKLGVWNIEVEPKK